MFQSTVALQQRIHSTNMLQSTVALQQRKQTKQKQTLISASI
jgi:hypothetical protein